MQRSSADSRTLQDLRRRRNLIMGLFDRFSLFSVREDFRDMRMVRIFNVGDWGWEKWEDVKKRGR
jgi:hypothetical protein